MRSEVSISDLKMHTGVSDDQLDMEITDLVLLADCFDSYVHYCDHLKLSSHEKADCRRVEYLHGSKLAMQKVLECWKKCNGCNAKYRALVDVCLDVRSGDVAKSICEHINVDRKQ